MSTTDTTVARQHTQARRDISCWMTGSLCTPRRRCPAHRRDPQVAQAIQEASARRALAVLQHTLAA